jgi:adenylate cyclase
MAEHTENDPLAEEMWRTYMTSGKIPGAPWFESKFLRPIVKLLPADPRCRICYYPFGGIGGMLVRTLIGLEASRMNPYLCNLCERACNKYRGGAEIELSMLFADVRGSTGLAEKMTAAEFSRLIDRFYRATTKVLFSRNALLEKLIGDGVTAFFVPGIAGDLHARVAFEAGEEILRATGHGDPDGPWIPVGVGIHTGVAFVGAVSTDGGVADITVLGDTANVAARIASQAQVGEVMLSDASRTAAKLKTDGMRICRLELKGRNEPVDVWVKKIGAGSLVT